MSSSRPFYWTTFISASMLTSWWWTFATALLFVTSAQSQTTDNGIASFLSEAYSVYTEVTSILASDAQSTAPSTSSSSITSTMSPSKSSITSMSVRPSTSSATLAGAASTSSVAPVSGNTGSHHNTLAIVLGSVLGALALGLLVLVLVLICCHRRRKARSHRALEPADEEVDSWRGNSRHSPDQDGLIGSHATAGRDHSMAAAVVPPMAEHPAYRNSHENPFVPVPPPPRRTAPNSKIGLTDGTVPGQEPFLSSNGGRVRGANGNSSSLPMQGRNHDHRAGEALAAGAGGAVLGAAAMHHHNQNRDGNSASEKRYSGHRRSLLRKPVPDAIETGDRSDAAFLNRSPNSPTLSPFNSAGHHRSHSQEALLAGGAAAGAGALGGAAVADHHKHRDHDADSGFFSDRSANTSAPRAATPMVPPIMTQLHGQRSTMPPDYDMVPNNENDHRDSRPVSGIAPAAALGAHSGDRESSPNRNGHFRNSTPPAVPSRSPRRTRFSDIPYDPANQGPAPPAAAVSSTDRESNNNSNSSDDSAFRLSSSIPGGWYRDSSDSDRHLRNSGINQHGRRSNSPRTGGREFASRDSGVSGMGTRPVTIAGARRQSPSFGPGMASGPRRHSQSPGDITSERVRLSDLRAEEEQKERDRQRGRRYGGMRSEWAGGNGYDGYERGSYGVGQAL